MANINHVIDADTAELVAAELGHTVKRVAEPTSRKACPTAADADENCRRVRRW